MILLTTMSCSNKNPNPEKWTDDEVTEWFAQQAWLEGWKAAPDASINKRSFAVHYYKNPKHWKQAFEFLAGADLKKMPLGKQELEGKHLFVALDEYTTKDKQDTKYESHRKYIDIQYIIHGDESMGWKNREGLVNSTEYDEEKDLEFFEGKHDSVVRVPPGSYTVRFCGASANTGHRDV